MVRDVHPFPSYFCRAGSVYRDAEHGRKIDRRSRSLARRQIEAGLENLG
jgi:hypothetical protein